MSLSGLTGAMWNHSTLGVIDPLPPQLEMGVQVALNQIRVAAGRSSRRGRSKQAESF